MEIKNVSPSQLLNASISNSNLKPVSNELNKELDTDVSISTMGADKNAQESQKEKNKQTKSNRLKGPRTAEEVEEVVSVLKIKETVGKSYQSALDVSLSGQLQEWCDKEINEKKAA